MIVDTLKGKFRTEIHLRPTAGAAATVIVWNRTGHDKWHWRWPAIKLLGTAHNMFVALEFAMVDYEKIMAGEGKSTVTRGLY